MCFRGLGFVGFSENRFPLIVTGEGPTDSDVATRPNPNPLKPNPSAADSGGI